MNTNTPMECMVFAAGLGTRLQSYTEHKPKALVEVEGGTLLEINLNRLIALGFRHIVVNVHAFSQQIIDFIENHHFEADILISDESEELLDTGGGLLKALPLFSGKKPILLYNVDVLSRIDLLDLYNTHTEQKAMATLAVSQRDTARYFLFCKNRLCGWENKKTGERIGGNDCENGIEYLAFSGIHVIEPSLVTSTELKGKFSMTDFYLKAMQNNNIQAYKHPVNQWLDVGTPERLEAAKKFIL